MVAATSPPSFLSSQFLGASFAHSSPPTAAASPSTSRVGFRSPRIAASASASAYTSSPRYEYDTPRLAQSTATAGTSLYEVLELPVGASYQEIKVAYRRLARLCHPDVRKDTSAEEFMKIHAAYTTLSDPEKRANYDLSLLRRITPSAARMTAPFTGCSRRTWETDQCW